jgi:hypothetical protein
MRPGHDIKTVDDYNRYLDGCVRSYGGASIEEATLRLLIDSKKIR